MKWIRDRKRPSLTHKLQWPHHEVYLERWWRWHSGNDGGSGGGSGGSTGRVCLHGDGADHVLHCVDFAVFYHFRSWRCLKHGILGPNGRDGHCKRQVTGKHRSGIFSHWGRSITFPMIFLKTKLGSRGLLPANVCSLSTGKEVLPKRERGEVVGTPSACLSNRTMWVRWRLPIDHHRRKV